jgi:hypothetical protein
VHFNLANIADRDIKVNEKYSRLTHQYDAFENMPLTNVEVRMNTIEECFAMEFVILVRSTRAIALPNL